MKNAGRLANAFTVSINRVMPVLLHMNSGDVKRKKNERKYWNQISRIYDSWIEKAFEDQYAEFRVKFSSSVQPTDTVLELGTGTGDIALHIAPHCKEVVGFDLRGFGICANNSCGLNRIPSDHPNFLSLTS